MATYDIYVIAIFKNANREVDGYRTWCNGQVDCISEKRLISMPYSMGNIKVENNKIVGSNGSLDRYAVIVEGMHIEKK